MARRGYKACEIVREFDHPYLDAYIDATRRSAGVVTVPKDRAAREIIERLADSYIVGILADQNPRENAVPVTFFGQPCWATIGPALAAARAHVPVVAVSIARDPDGGYTVEFSPPIQWLIPDASATTCWKTRSAARTPSRPSCAARPSSGFGCTAAGRSVPTSKKNGNAAWRNDEGGDKSVYGEYSRLPSIGIFVVP